VADAMKQMTSLSSQLFLVLHDPFSGKRKVSQELLECGVAAAQLADLIIARQLVIKDDHVVLAGPTQVGLADRIGDYVLGCVAEQSSTYPVRQWVSSLGASVTDLVVRELVDTGVVRHERPRGLRGRKPDRFPAEDLLRASSPRVRVRRMLTHPAEFDLAGATLASMVGVLGAHQVFEVHDTRDLLREMHTYMPLPLQAVMAGLAATVAAASVSLGGR
jgi:Golgi phosphoprotein 3 (GPP34)